MTGFFTNQSDTYKEFYWAKNKKTLILNEFENKQSKTKVKIKIEILTIIQTN